LEKNNERQLVGWIVAVSGAHRGQDFRVFSGKNIIGTSADCDIVVTECSLAIDYDADGNPSPTAAIPSRSTSLVPRR